MKGNLVPRFLCLTGAVLIDVFVSLSHVQKRDKGPLVAQIYGYVSSRVCTAFMFPQSRTHGFFTFCWCKNSSSFVLEVAVLYLNSFTNESDKKAIPLNIPNLQSCSQCILCIFPVIETELVVATS